MSDSYNPPSGPKGARSEGDTRQQDRSRDHPARGHRGGHGGGGGNSEYNGGQSGRNRYPNGSGPKRYSDREGYRQQEHYSQRDDEHYRGNKRPHAGVNEPVNKRGRGNFRGRGSGRPPYQLSRRDYETPSRAGEHNDRNPSKYPDEGYYDNHNAEYQKLGTSGGFRGTDRNRGRGRGQAPGRGRDRGIRGGRFDSESGARLPSKAAPPGPPGPPKAKPGPPPKLALSKTYSVRTPVAEIYKRVQQVGEGTYGKVYKAQNILTGQFVALKKLRLESEREGFPITAMREIKLLQSFDHPNVLGLLEMMVEHNQIFMVSDYMDHDMTGLLTHPDLDLHESHRKFIFKQLMEGINYLHCRRIIHRDIKGSNILLDSIGRLKIADFGLARTMKTVNDSQSPDYTNRVITIWYRPPELLLGSTDYGREVDIWGVGCLLIELYTKRAAFQGFDEVGQLNKIYNTMGTPTSDDWPAIEELPWFEMLRPRINRMSSFKELFGSVMSEHGFDLAEVLLKYDPKKRWTALEALEHPYFTSDPQPEPLHMLKDIKGEWHEFETKKRRRQERKRVQEEEEAMEAARKEKMSKSLAEYSTAEPVSGKSIDVNTSVNVLMRSPTVESVEQDRDGKDGKPQTPPMDVSPEAETDTIEKTAPL